MCYISYHLSALRYLPTLCMMQEVGLCKLIYFLPALPLEDIRGRLQVQKREKDSFFPLFCLWASSLFTVPLSIMQPHVSPQQTQFLPKTAAIFQHQRNFFITPSSGTPGLASSTPSSGVMSLLHRPSSKLRGVSTSQAASPPQIFQF